MGLRVSLEDIMKCVICEVGETQRGTTTMAVERGTATIVIKQIPAKVCENCGEAYVDSETAGHVLEMIEEATRTGVQVEVREYRAA